MSDEFQALQEHLEAHGIKCGTVLGDTEPLKIEELYEAYIHLGTSIEAGRVKEK